MYHFQGSQKNREAYSKLYRSRVCIFMSTVIDPHLDDFKYRTSVNEKTYDFSVNISGILWALGVYFYLKDSSYSSYSLYFAISMFVLSFLIPYLFYTKKDKIQRNKGKLFSLGMSGYVILADFLAKFVCYGLIACVVGFHNKLEAGKNCLSAFILMFLHCLAFWGARHIYWRFGEEERDDIVKEVLEK